MSGYDTISFCSDYGLTDEFVGVVHAVIAELAPAARIIDLTHGIPAHDVRAGSLVLARTIQYVPAGVVLAVVDPGVGTERRAVAVEVGEGAGVLIGPDNGLLAPAVAMAGGASRAVELTNPDFRLPSVGATFDGRDLFAPAAAHLCNGVPLGELGRPIEPGTLLPSLVPLPRPEGGELVCEVLWVDHFGNAQLNVGPDEVSEWGERVMVNWAEQARVARVARAFGELARGELGLVVDSYGLLALAFDQQPAAAELDVAVGDEIRLSEPV